MKTSKECINIKAVQVIHKPRKQVSHQRKHLMTATWEGVPAIILQTLLGGPFLTGYLLYLGAESSEVGFVLAVTTLFNVLQILVAYLIQRLQYRKKAMIVFTFMHRMLWGATGLIPFIFPERWWVPVFMILYMGAFIANTVSGMLWTSLISDMVPAKVRGRYFGIRNTILNALGALTLFVGGIILDRYPGGGGFLILFMISWIAIAANLSMFFLYPDPPFEHSSERQFRAMIRKPLSDTTFIKSTLFLAGWLFLQTLIVPLYSYAMLDVLHISYSIVSIMTVAQTVIMMTGFYVWGNLNARFSNRTLLYWTLPLIAGSCLTWGLLSVLPVIPVLLLSHMLLGAGVGGFNQLAFNFMIGDTPKSERPMFIAVYSSITGFASFLGPMLGGLIFKGIAHAPDWVSRYGFQTAVGVLMVLIALTVGRRVLRSA
ncbi:MFS transporter [Paenibacillus sp. FSL H8-0457]|uniref:MFS transporter n=1 Tax=Bacillales TaxID=1385 RepID=UPI0003E26B0B|nr:MULTISPECIES: MFS transporter [Paenibacillus]ETT60542.1 major facilitator superfamily protein [Paenibacillus sp. FSL H8-457]MCM3261629.1 MFS transporter [Paenibacillus lautus]